MRRIILKYRGDAIELPLGVTVVGRDLECRLRIHDPAVSRRHLRFVHRKNELFVEDLSSANGTLLNGRPVFQPIRLHHGDVLTLGSRQIEVAFLEGGAGVMDLEPSTIVGGQPVRILPEEAPVVSSPVKRTTKMAVPSTADLPAEQRCPQCGAVVALAEDECPSCGHSWGGFHPHSSTRVGPSPLRERRHPRREVSVPIIYRSATLEIEAQTRDLSLSGVFVCTKIFDAEGTECTLTVLIDGGPSVEIAGRVQRVVRGGGGNDGLGVAFENLGETARTWLEALVRPED